MILAILTGLAGCLHPGITPADEESGITGGDSVIHFYTEEQPPFNYITNQGLVSGSSTEVVREIADRTGDRIEIILVPWEKGVDTVSKTSNTALYSTVLTREREPVYKWVGPISSVELAVFSRADAPCNITDMADLAGKGPIAVVNNDVREEILRNAGLTDILTFTDDYTCIRTLDEGKAAFWFGSSDILAQSSKTLEIDPSGFRRVYVYMDANVYIAFNRKTDPALIQRWQTALDEMTTDGTLEMIQERYMPFVCSWVECVP